MKTCTTSCRGWLYPKHLQLSVLLIVLLGIGCGKPAAPVDLQRPFSMVVLPDTQHYSQKRPDLFFSQTNWIKQNHAKENIAFVVHVGDLVNSFDRRPSEWKVADEAMAVLDGVVPYGVAIGNHDYNDNEGLQNGIATMYLQHFDPEKRFKGRPGYGGSSPNRLNSYHLLSAGGTDFVILFLEMNAPDYALEWAKGVLTRFPDRPVILALHCYLLGMDGISRDNRPSHLKGGNTGEMIWEKFIRSQPRIFMVVCGHVDKPEEYHQISRNDAGTQVLEMLSDYQTRVNGGDGWLRLIRFDPSKREIQVRTYSPSLDRFEIDFNSEFVAPWLAN